MKLLTYIVGRFLTSVERCIVKPKLTKSNINQFRREASGCMDTSFSSCSVLRETARISRAAFTTKMKLNETVRLGFMLQQLRKYSFM